MTARRIATEHDELVAVVHHLSESVEHLITEVRAGREAQGKAQTDQAVLAEQLRALRTAMDDLRKDIEAVEPRHSAKVVGAAAVGGGGLVVAITEALQRLFG